MATCTCAKCNKTMQDKQFYTYPNGEKMELCKQCFTMHMDPFDPSTFVWALEKMDLPYLPEEWNVLRDKDYAKNPAKISGGGVFGKYLSKMKLKQWIDPATGKRYTYSDSERLQERNAEKKKEAERNRLRYEEETKAKYERGEITESEYKTLVSVEEQHRSAEAMLANPQSQLSAPQGSYHNENNYISEDELIDFSMDLTQEDKISLATKWGRFYKPNEWIELERNYREMEKSFDIQDADTINTLKHLCKTNLKMNQAIDVGDLDGYQKLSRVYDSLRKSAKFTAVQNKEQKGDFVDCIGTMVDYCEKIGGEIPKFEIKADQDIVDTVIKDLKNYTKSLIYEDKSLAKQIEDYIKKKEISEAMKKDKDKNDEDLISDQDIMDNLERIREEQNLDNEEDGE